MSSLFFLGQQILIRLCCSWVAVMALAQGQFPFRQDSKLPAVVLGSVCVQILPLGSKLWHQSACSSGQCSTHIFSTSPSPFLALYSLAVKLLSFDSFSSMFHSRKSMSNGPRSLSCNLRRVPHNILCLIHVLHPKPLTFVEGSRKSSHFASFKEHLGISCLFFVIYR